MEKGTDVLIVDDDEGNVKMARHVMPGITSCGHDECVPYLRRGEHQKVLISADGEEAAMKTMSIALIAACHKFRFVGILSTDGKLPEDLAHQFLIVNMTIIFSCDDREGVFLTDQGGKDWRRFLIALFDREPRIVTFSVPW